MYYIENGSRMQLFSFLFLHFLIKVHIQLIKRYLNAVRIISKLHLFQQSATCRPKVLISDIAAYDQLYCRISQVIHKNILFLLFQAGRIRCKLLQSDLLCLFQICRIGNTDRKIQALSSGVSSFV